MNIKLWFALAILLAPFACFALSPSETNALEALAQLWTPLQGLNPPWRPDDASAACNTPIWSGLLCSPGPDSHVVGLHLVNVSLDQEIPPEFSALTHLRNFSIESGNLTGTIPASLVQIPSLQALVITNSPLLVGPVPNSIVRALNLTVIRLEALGLIGSLPVDIRELPRLSHLIVHCPYINGPLPWPLYEQRDSIRVLDFTGTPVQGTFPREIDTMWNLEELRLGNTQVAGYIPPSLWALKEIRVIDFSHLSVSGSLIVFGLKKLEILRLDHTLMFSSLPRDIGDLKQLKELNIAYTSFSGELLDSLGYLENLEILDISYTSHRGPIPASLGNLTKLKSLNMAGASLRGTVPPGLLSRMDDLFTLDLSSNNLNGPIPVPSANLRRPMDFFIVSLNLFDGTLEELVALPNFSAKAIDLSYNLLTGTLPPQLLHMSTSITLQNNHLSGTIPSPLEDSLVYVDLSNNVFEGVLPEVGTNSSLVGLLLSGNQIFASIPSSYQQLTRLQELILRDNLLEGTIPAGLGALPDLSLIDLSSNQLYGPIPNFTGPNFVSMKMSGNQLTEPPINLSPSVRVIDVSRNQLSGELGFITSTMNLPNSRLESIDISDNKFTAQDELFLMFSSATVKYLNIAGNSMTGLRNLEIVLPKLVRLDASRNNFSGTIPANLCLSQTLTFVDLSSNQLSGELSFAMPRPGQTYGCIALTELNLANNHFTGGLYKIHIPLLQTLSIANNQFGFDVSEFGKFSELQAVDASNNAITGLLSLSGMIELQTMNLRGNWLNEKIDLEGIAFKYHFQQLSFLAIENNPQLPIIYDVKNIDIGRSRFKERSTKYPLLECYQLQFDNSSAFLYDEQLFNWHQCDCQLGYFGLPPTQCYPCGAGAKCPGGILQLEQHQYLYTENDAPLVEMTHFYIESCTLGIFPPESNCKATPIETDRQTGRVKPFQQCKDGSRGRICAECICEPDLHGGTCYYEQGAHCIKCKKVFDQKITIPLAALLCVLATLTLTPLMYAVLRSRRRAQELEWNQLSRFKRLVYRLIYASRLGYLPIALSFIQIVSELTPWEVYATRSWAKTLNGEAESIGIRCVFPFLASPLPRLLARLLFPVLVLVIILSSISLAELLSRIQNSRKSHRKHHGSKRPLPQTDPAAIVLSPQIIEDTLGESRPLLKNGSITSSARIDISDPGNDLDLNWDDLKLVPATPYEHQPYPVSAFLSSTAISVAQFFYFGTALTATEFFFSELQAESGRKYVQSHPWMTYDSATPLRNVSIPFLILFVVGLPLAFLVAVWKIRHKASSPTITKYFGTIFVRYRPSFYWWEIINVTRKLAIALFLRGIGSASALQPGLAILCIGVVLCLQATFQPWKRRLENVMDTIAAFLLISTTVTTHLSDMLQSEIVIYSVIAMNSCFILASVILIIFQGYSGTTEYQYNWILRHHAINQPQIDFNEPLMKNSINVVESQGYIPTSDPTVTMEQLQRAVNTGGAST